MASTRTNIVPHKKSRGAAKQLKKNSAKVYRSNRKALKDIGNSIPEVLIPNCTITRKSFHAQLLANAQAKAAANNKRAKDIIDIDAKDANNELAAVEYIQDLYKFYKTVEIEKRPCHDYMDSKPKINEYMRAMLVDFIVDVHKKFELSYETLYLTFNIVDRFLETKSVPSKELPLVGICAMLMASKYEEIRPQTVNNFVCLSSKHYTHEQILAMEKIILQKLEWNLTVPTHYVFLVRFLKAAASIPKDEILENSAYFLCELGMMHYATLMYSPSMVSASAVYVARCTLNITPFWNETLKVHTGYSEEILMDCARHLVSYHSSVGNGELKAIYRKYSDPQKGAVALLPPAKYISSAI